MKTNRITIKGKNYITCFSTRVLLAVEDREGDCDKGLQRIMKDGKISDMFWLLAQMIDAGDRYAKMEGIENPGVLTYDELVDSVGVDEYQTMFGAIVNAVKADSTPKVQTKPAKNAKTTQPEA